MIVKSLGYEGNNARAKRKGKEHQPERERKNRSDSNLYLKRIHGKICIPHTIIVAIIIAGSPPIPLLLIVRKTKCDAQASVTR